MAIAQGFFNTLRASRRRIEWFVNSKGAIRGRLRARKGAQQKGQGGAFCPLTGAAFVRKSEKLTLDNTDYAGQVLGLKGRRYTNETTGVEESFVSAVVWAADRKRTNPKRCSQRYAGRQRPEGAQGSSGSVSDQSRAGLLPATIGWTWGSR